MMAKESAASLSGAATLDSLASTVAASSRPAAPVDTWDPPFCGDIDMRIAGDGTWFYAGTPIGRPALVRLFASILRRDPDGFMLVTPVEKVRIQVEDAPFRAVELALGPEPDPALLFRTDVDEWVEAGPRHSLRFAPGASGGLKPYLLVRRGLEALVKRAVFFELVERGETRIVDGRDMFGVASAECFFAMAPASSLLDVP